jgi:hypothetical protein
MAGLCLGHPTRIVDFDSGSLLGMRHHASTLSSLPGAEMLLQGQSPDVVTPAHRQ